MQAAAELEKATLDLERKAVELKKAELTIEELQKNLTRSREQENQSDLKERIAYAARVIQ